MGSVILSTFPQLSLLKGEKTNLTYTLLIYNKFRNKLSKIIDTFRLRDLLAPPGNRLEKLKGDREGQYGIQINDQWRICFEWNGNKARNVEIVDYHG